MCSVPLLIYCKRHLNLRPHGDPGAAGDTTPPPPPRLITARVDLSDPTAHNCIQQSHHYRADNGVWASKEKWEISGAGKRERRTERCSVGEQRRSLISYLESFSFVAAQNKVTIEGGSQGSSIWALVPPSGHMIFNQIFPAPEFLTQIEPFSNEQLMTS